MKKNYIFVLSALVVRYTSGEENTITLSAETIVIGAQKLLEAGSEEVVSISAGTTLDAFASKNATFASSAEATIQGNTKTVVTAAGAVVLDGAVIKLN